MAINAGGWVALNRWHESRQATVGDGWPACVIRVNNLLPLSFGISRFLFFIVCMLVFSFAKIACSPCRLQKKPTNDLYQLVNAFIGKRCRFVDFFFVCCMVMRRANGKCPAGLYQNGTPFIVLVDVIPVP